MGFWWKGGWRGGGKVLSSWGFAELVFGEDLVISGRGMGFQQPVRVEVAWALLFAEQVPVSRIWAVKTLWILRKGI